MNHFANLVILYASICSLGYASHQSLSEASSEPSAPIITKLPGKNVFVLNEKIYNKFIKDPNYDVIVHYYSSNEWKSQQFWPQFEKYAEAFSGEDNLALAVIDLGADSQFKWDLGVLKFPAFKLFRKGLRKYAEVFQVTSDPIYMHRGDAYMLDAKGLLKWTNNKLNLKRDLGGVIPLLDILSRDFIRNEDYLQRKAVLTRAAKNLKTLSEDDLAMGKFYVALMKLALDRGEVFEFVRSEFSRMKTLIEARTLTADKQTETAKRLNIVGAMKNYIVEVEMEKMMIAERAAAEATANGQRNLQGGAHTE